MIMFSRCNYVGCSWLLFETQHVILCTVHPQLVMAVCKVLGVVDEYVDNLDEDLRDIAKKELREDDETRSQCLQAFRDWILKNPDIIKCRLDSSFLLRFLRVKKHSILLAQDILMKYITTRRVITDLFTNLDCLEPSVKMFYDKKIIYMLKGKNDDGRRVMHIQHGLIEPGTQCCTLIRAFTIAAETLIAEHDVQIAGVSYILDYKDAGLGFLAMWNPTILQRMAIGLIKSFPMRHKEIHCLNLPPLLNSFIKIFMKVSGKKLQQRFVVHGTGIRLEDVVPKRMLPKEYGGSECTMQELTESWKKELLEYRDTLLQLDELAVSEASKSKRANEILPDHDLGCDGNFRQLQID